MLSLTPALALLLGTLNAQTIRTWQGGTGGSWNNPGSWSDGIIPDSATDIAVFTAAATVTIDNPAGFSVGGLATASGGVTLNAGTGGGLTLAGPSAVITNGGSLNINVSLTSSGFDKYGSGTLQLTVDNSATLAGATIRVRAGQLRGYSGNAGSGKELGDATTTLIMQSGTQIRYFNVSTGERNYTPTLRLNGTGLGSNPGVLNNDSNLGGGNNLVWSGDIFLDSDARIATQNQGTYTLGSISGPDYTLTQLQQNNTTTITGAVTVASYIKQSGGTVSFDAGGSLTTSALNLQGGTVSFAPGASLSGATNFSLSGGGVLDISQTMAQTVILGSGHTLTASGNATLRGSLTINAGSQAGPGTGAATYNRLTVTNALTLNGGRLRFDLNTSAFLTSDDIQVGDLSLSGPTTIELNFPSGAPELGTPYTLIGWTGTKTGTAANLTAVIVGLGRIKAAFDDTSTPNALTVTFSGAVPNLVWKGDGTANVWDVQGAANWLNNGLPDSFLQGDNVSFDDTGFNTPPVSIATNVAPNSLTMSASQNYTLVGPGKITGLTALTVSSSGALTLATANDYSGGTVINFGTLKLGADEAIPDGSGKGALDVNGTFDTAGFTETVNAVSGFGTIDNSTGNGQLNLGANNQSSTFYGNLQNSGGTLSITKIGTGTLTLFGSSSSFSGGTTIASSRIEVQSSFALGTGPITVQTNNNSNNQLVLTASDLDVTNALVINGGGAVQQGVLYFNLAGGSATYRGPITINGPSQAGGHFATVNGGELVIAGPITSTNNVSMRYGLVTLSNAASSFPQIRVAEGTLKLGLAGAIPPSASVVVGDTGNNNNQAAFDLNGIDQELTGLTRNAFGSSSASRVNNSAPTPAVLRLNIPAETTNTYSGFIEGDVALVSKGDGVLRFTQTNSYTGPTTVLNGTLLVDGSLSTSALSVQGGRLGGTGAITSSIVVDSGGAIGAGFAIGTLLIGGDLSIAGDVVVAVNPGATPPNDAFEVTGPIVNTGSGSLRLSNVGSALAPGNTFQIFNKAVVNGDALAVASDVPGVVWENRLAVDGSIAVVSVAPTTPPGFSPGGVAILPDGNISLTATGAIGGTYTLWASTNVALSPIHTTWTLLNSGTIAESPFSINDLSATNYPRRFYLFSVP